ncbi:MAG: nucleoside triphosphate pyrophosphohydrolase family protein [Saprospiraceae bacterium]
MDKLDALNQVADFHRTFRHPVESTPIIPSPARCQLRVALLQEELDELKDAIAKADITEVADALCDIQYVLAGAVLEFGLGDKFRTLFDEVQRSNMSKACSTREEAEATAEHYRTQRDTDCFIEQAGDLWLVYRTGDRKTLKSIYYSPANLRDIIG